MKPTSTFYYLSLKDWVVVYHKFISYHCTSIILKAYKTNVSSVWRISWSCVECEVVYLFVYSMSLSMWEMSGTNTMSPMCAGMVLKEWHRRVQWWVQESVVMGAIVCMGTWECSGEWHGECMRVRWQVQESTWWVHESAVVNSLQRVQ